MISFLLNDAEDTNISNNILFISDVLWLLPFIALIIITDLHFMAYFIDNIERGIGYFLQQISANLKANTILNKQIWTVLVLSSFEELFFRGVLFVNFSRSLTVNKANYITAIIFMVFHSVLNITIIFKSLLLGYAFSERKSIIFVMIIHIFMNIITDSMPVSYQYAGGDAVIELTLSGIALAFLVDMAIRHRPKSITKIVL